MTLKEKIGQLFMLGFMGTTVSKDWSRVMTEYQPGGVILFSRNLVSRDQIVRLTNELQKRVEIPLLISIDQEGGRVSRLPKGFTIFPAAEVVGHSQSTLAYGAAAAIANELRAVGVNMNMAPVLDVNSNPDNPIIGDRAFGATATAVCEFGLATMAGLQDHRVVACGKHFPGHGDTIKDSHKELPVVSAPIERLRDMELRPFQHAIENGLASLMTAHVVYEAVDPSLPATLSPIVLRSLLREEFGYDGLVLTDDLEMHAIIDHYGIEEAAVRAFLAGVDILLICKEHDREVAAMEAMLTAVKDGTISEARLEASLRRIARVKDRFVLPYEAARIPDAKSVVGCSAHQDVLSRVTEGRGRGAGVAV
ncbi:glycoside hydrolase family 3 [Nitrospira sp.]|nr:glycoside hydrolase family 3 [Nitrospira sp.]